MREVSNDELASMLVESAALVRQGKRSDPLLNKTMEAFLSYLEHPSNSKTSSVKRKTGQNATVGGMFNRMMKMANGETGPDAVAHEPPKTQEQKAETSRKNAERAKADLQGEENNKGSTSNFGFSFPTIPGFTDGDAPQKKTQESAPEPRKAPQQSQTRTTSPTPAASASATPASASRGQTEESKPTPTTTTTGGSSSGGASKGRAEFQRPANQKSALIANGWIEQQRRSKMRTAWKDVLASLVEGRKPGEETTLWIQRQVVNPQTNQTELEALHQIPVKWLEDVTYLDYSADNRFSLKVFNLQEEFVFRCPTSSEAAQDWVTTLLSVRDSKPKKGKAKRDPDNISTASGVSNTSARAATSPERRRPTPATATKQKSRNRVAAASTGRQRPTSGDGPNPFDEEKKSGEQSADATPSKAKESAPQQQQKQQPQKAEKKHRSIKELRAIAHGAGVQTAGMERRELEGVVAKIEAAQNQPPAQEQDRKQVERERMEHERRVKEEQQRRAAEERRAAQEENERRVAAAAAEERRRKEEEEAARLAEQERQEEEERAAAAKQAQEQEEIRRRIAERVHAQQDAERKKRVEEERIRLEKERIAREEAEHQRRVAEMQEREAVRKQQEQYQRQQEEYARQQRAWQEQQAEAARQQQLRAEHEARLREEEARRRREAERWTQTQQTQQQAPAPAPYGYPPQQGRPAAPPPHAHAAYQQQPHQQHYPQQQQHAYPPHPGAQPQQHAPPPQHAYYQQQQQAPRAPPPGPPPPQHAPPPGAPPPQQQQQQHQQQQAPPPGGASGVNAKYAKMANEDEGTKNQKIKHSLLVQWALNPPMLQALKPIEMLITTVHTVFPPALGVSGHEYFKKWKAVAMEDIAPAGQRVDDDKLNKAVRKLRFFLHPDKLPKDLTADQSFLIKLLWDITNDAFEEHKKREEDLGWIKS